MLEEGVVSSVNQGKLIVNIKRHPACGACKACNMGEDRVMSLELDNSIDAHEGDKVKIELDDSIILKGALVVYGLPLLGLMIGILLGSKIAIYMNRPYEIIGAICGIVSMLVTFLFIKRYNSRNKDQYKPRLIKIER